MNRKGNAIRKGILLTVFLLAGFLVAHKVEAQLIGNSMNEWYSSSNATGHFIESTNLRLGQGGVSDTEVQLNITVKPIDTAPEPKGDDADNRILKKFEYTDGFVGAANALNVGKINVPTTSEANSILGSWRALYNPSELKPVSGNGAWLEYAKKSDLSAACLDDSGSTPGSINGFVSDSCFPINQRIALIYIFLTKDAAGNLPMRSNVINQSLRTSSLTPDTEYVARIRIEEDGSPDVGSSKLFAFRTLPAGSASLIQQGVQQTSSNTVTDGDAELPECGIFSSSKVMGCVGQIVYFIVFKPTSFVMALAGEIMDWGIGYSIDSNSYPVSGHSFVTDGWRVMRDLANIFFIFILVFIAITTIIGKKNDRFIGMVILVALTINFSLFMTKVIVDFGNIASRFFYNQISVTNTQNQQQITSSSSNYKSISYGFAATFNPLKLFKGLTPQTSISTSGGTTNVGLTDEQYASFFALFSLVGAVVNLVAAFVFFSLAWLFIARVAGIWLAMIFAPLAFLSLALPVQPSIAGKGAAKYMNFNSWIKSLLEMAVMPAIAMLMIFLILSFLKSNFLGQLGSSTTTTGMFMSVLLPLLVISILLLKTKETAQSMSGDFGAAMGKVGSFVGGAAVGLATGGVAIAGRNLAGRMAGSIASEKVREAAAKGDKGAMRRVQLADSMKNATFDARNTVAGNWASKNTGMDFKNKGLAKAANFAGNIAGYEKDYFTTKGGAKGMQDRTKKAELEKAKLLEVDKDSPQAKAWGKKFADEEVKVKAQEEKTKEATEEQKESSKKLAEQQKKVKEMEESGKYKPDDIAMLIEKNKIEALEKELELKKKITEKEKENLKAAEKNRDINDIKEINKTRRNSYADQVEAGVGNKYTEKNAVAAANAIRTNEKIKSEKPLDKIKDILKDLEKEEGGGDEKKEEKKNEKKDEEKEEK